MTGDMADSWVMMVVCWRVLGGRDNKETACLAASVGEGDLSAELPREPRALRLRLRLVGLRRPQVLESFPLTVSMVFEVS